MRAHGSAPDLPRDRAVLIRLARHRVLSLAQLQRLVFPGLHRSRVSRRVAALEHGGWVSHWEQPVEQGGHPRLVLPTAKALRWALARIASETATHPYARLVATMPRRDDWRPPRLVRGVMPPWLAHLHEVNDVLIALQTDRELAVCWASSWHRPFHDVRRGAAMPQPDGVLVQQTPDGSGTLVLLEHDRGGESLAHFCSSKVDRYRQLARRPELLAELTGYRAFRVLVTVCTGDPTTARKRIADLECCAGSRLAGRLFTFATFEQGATTGASLSGVGPVGGAGRDRVSQLEGVVPALSMREALTGRHDHACWPRIVPPPWASLRAPS